MPTPMARFGSCSTIMIRKKIRNNSHIWPKASMKRPPPKPENTVPRRPEPPRDWTAKTNMPQLSTGTTAIQPTHVRKDRVLSTTTRK